jgi:hypothetical protein
VAILAATLFVVACSDDAPTKAEYAREIQRSMREVEHAYDTSAKDPETTRLTLADAADRLDAIEAPEELRDVHAELVAAVRDMSGAIRLLSRAREVVETDPKRAERLTKQFASDNSFRRAEQAVAALHDAGVDVDL